MVLADLNSKFLEMFDRLARIEEKVTPIANMMNLVEKHTEQITRLEENVKNIKEELIDQEDRRKEFKNEIYRNVIVAVGAIELFLSLIDKLGGKL